LRRVRQAMRGVLEAAAARRAPDAGELDEINRALRTHYIYELVPATDGVSLDHRHQGDPVDGAIARLAEAIARELIQGDTERLRICENAQCRWVFKDTSRTGKRKWCSMRSCGNRAKVARHRARVATSAPARAPRRPVAAQPCGTRRTPCARAFPSEARTLDAALVATNRQ